MYKRNEVVEEEHLEWNKKTEDTIQEKDPTVTLSPEAKHEKLLIDKKKKNHIISIFNKKLSIINKTKELPSYLGEKITFFLLLIIFPYILGTFLFFILIPLLAGIDLNILFIAIDFFNWITHFLFWSIGYIILTFSGFSFLLYKARH